MLNATVGAFVALGLAAGVLGGMFGIGGGLVIVPALAVLFGFEVKAAFGTSMMAQLLPVGLLGVAEYWRRSEVDARAGLWIAAGLFVGALIGAWLTGLLPPAAMKRAYGLFLVLIGLYFLFDVQGKLLRRAGAAPRATAAARPAPAQTQRPSDLSS